MYSKFQFFQKITTRFLNIHIYTQMWSLIKTCKKNLLKIKQNQLWSLHYETVYKIDSARTSIIRIFFSWPTQFGNFSNWFIVTITLVFNKDSVFPCPLILINLFNCKVRLVDVRSQVELSVSPNLRLIFKFC